LRGSWRRVALGGEVALRHQGGQVVGQDFGRNVDDQCLLAQARNTLQFEPVFEPVFEPFEGLLDTPSLVIQRREYGDGEVRFAQVGGQ